MKVKYLALSVLVAPIVTAPPASSQTPPAPTVPIAFIGEWNADPARCLERRNPGGFGVRRDLVTFDGVYRVVLAVDGVSAREMVVSLRVFETEPKAGYGRRSVRLQLSADGKQLTEFGPDGVGVTRHKCPYRPGMENEMIAVDDLPTVLAAPPKK